MIQYLMAQTERMNEAQRGLVARCADRPESEWIKAERDRLTKLYMWLHMKPGSVASRKF